MASHLSSQALTGHLEGLCLYSPQVAKCYLPLKGRCCGAIR